MSSATTETGRTTYRTLGLCFRFMLKHGSNVGRDGCNIASHKSTLQTVVAGDTPMPSSKA